VTWGAVLIRNSACRQIACVRQSWIDGEWKGDARAHVRRTVPAFLVSIVRFVFCDRVLVACLDVIVPAFAEMDLGAHAPVWLQHNRDYRQLGKMVPGSPNVGACVAAASRSWCEIGILRGWRCHRVCHDVNPHPQIEKSWDLPNDTHVDIFFAWDIFGPCRTLRERNRSGLTSRAWSISACSGGNYPAMLKRASSKCVVSVRVNEGDSVPDVLDESSIRFTPECHAVEQHD
jgi:hypothetical protein